MERTELDMCAKLYLIKPVMKEHNDPYNRVVEALVVRFGGCTVQEGVGYWQGPAHRPLDVDGVYIVEVFTENSQAAIDFIHSTMLWYKEAAKQMAVLYAINGVGHLIEGEQHAG